MRSEQINELATALSKAQGMMGGAAKDGLNPHFKSRYATLDSIWDAIREPLAKNGLAVSQTISSEGEMLVLITTLMHSSGQWIDSALPLISAKATPQALGSAATYMRRYALAAIVGATSGDDDDANEAERHAKHLEEKPLTLDEIGEIEKNIDPTDVEYKTKLFTYFKIRSFADLHRKDYGRCLEAVMKRKETKTTEEQ